MVAGSAQGCILATECRTTEAARVGQITVESLGYSYHLKRQYLWAQNKTDVAWQVRHGAQVTSCSFFHLSVWVKLLYHNLQMSYVACYTSQVFYTLAPHQVPIAINFSSKVLKSCNGRFCDTYECLEAWAPTLFIYRLLDILGSHFWNGHSSITVGAIATHA